MSTFDLIAEDWEKYRNKAAHYLHFFTDKLRNKRNLVILDAGAGNGRNDLELLKYSRKLILLDSSKKMLEFAKKRIGKKNAEFLFGDITSIPLRNESVDAILCTAMLHHLSTRNKREKAFSELFRVLKFSGVVFLTVWNIKQKKFLDLSLDRDSNAYIRWSDKRRFYHFFSSTELEKLARGAGFKTMNIFFEKHGKICSEDGAENICAFLYKFK